MVELKSSPELSGVDWHGLLSLFSRTLPAKMSHLATRETFFICRIFFITIVFLLFFAWVRPPGGVFCKEQALYIAYASALKAPLFF